LIHNEKNSYFPFVLSRSLFHFRHDSDRLCYETVHELGVKRVLTMKSTSVQIIKVSSFDLK
jgi:hypothetical protein